MNNVERIIKAVTEAFDIVKSEYEGTSYFNEAEFEKDKHDAIALLSEKTEIIRCKDCNNTGIDSSSYPQYWCSAHTEYVPPDYFCASGKRKELKTL